MILAKTTRRRSRLNSLLVTVIAILAFTFGGLATVGALKVAEFFRADTPVSVATVEEVAPEVEATEVTRTTPQTLLAVSVDATQRPNPRPVITEPEPLAAEPELAASQPVTAPVTASDLSTGPELQTLAFATTIGAYDLIAEDVGAATRIVLYYRDMEPTAAALREKIGTSASAGLINADYAQMADSDGIDTQILMFEMVQTKLADSGSDAAQAARVLRQKAFAASDARTELVDGVKVYTVRPGDSLAYIALQFYGTTKSAQQILAANASVLSAPTELKVGMQLIIPNA